MDIHSKMAKLLMEIGFLAVGQGMTAKADTIFDAVAVLKPNAENSMVGKAVNMMNNRSPEDAAAMLRDKVLAKYPDSDSAKAFLGLALKLAGRSSEAESVLAQLAAETKENDAAAMAKNLLADLRR